MLYAASHRRSQVKIQRQNSSRESRRPSTPTSHQRPRYATSDGLVGSSRPSSAQRPRSATIHEPRKGSPARKPKARISLLSLSPMKLIRRPRFSFFTEKKKAICKNMTSSTALDESNAVGSDANTHKKEKKGRKTNPRDDVLAETKRVESIRKLIDSKDYNAALGNLMSDCDADLHYFNRIKAETLGEEHYGAFSRKHGKLQDFQERPPPVDSPNTCLWSGANDFGHALRCNNKCLYHPIERVPDQLGVERPKPLDFCVYHVKYCVNTDNHARMPMKIRVPNDCGLCNECFLMKTGQPPKELMRVPGTRRKRG